MLQFQRAFLDSLPGSFLLAKQALKRLHKDSNRLPQDSLKLRLPQSLTGDHEALGARWDMLQQGEGKC